VPQGKELEQRLETVLETIYLLFNEAYSASKGDDIIRFELCQEAIRLTEMLDTNEIIRQKGNVYALLSLMFLNASRFSARQDKEGNLLIMAEQDRSLWDRKLQGTGLHYLQRATENAEVSNYLILAAISANYCIATDYESTDWENILTLYDNLMEIDPSPVVLLNRAIVLSKIDGAAKALDELERIESDAQLKSYHLFYSTKAEFFIQLGLFENAVKSLENAIGLAPLISIKELLRKKLEFCKEKAV